MSEKDTDPRSTIDNHRDCMRIVAEVEACLDRPPDREGQWLAELRDKLPALAETLRGHFADEEHEYLYTELPAQKPRFADRLAALKSEHRSMLEEVDEAISRAGKVEGGELHELRELNACVQLLVATIRRHEAEENEIVLRAYWHDVGAGD
jgi:ElaB/YqjD/DUF883 family membrane-anchored ribosome-binding protein